MRTWEVCVCLCVCVCVCARACVRMCVRMCVCAWGRVSSRALLLKHIVSWSEPVDNELFLLSVKGLLLSRALGTTAPSEHTLTPVFPPIT